MRRQINQNGLAIRRRPIILTSVREIIAATATIVAGAVNIPTTANAGCYGCGVGAVRRYGGWKELDEEAPDQLLSFLAFGLLYKQCGTQPSIQWPLYSYSPGASSFIAISSLEAK